MHHLSEVELSQNFLARLVSISPSTMSRHVEKYLQNSQDHNLIIRSQNKRKKYSVAQVHNMLREFYAKKIIVEKKVQVFFNFKGGTGKTSLCYQTASLLALCGFKVLAVDLDPQAHLSHSFGFDINSDFLTLYDAVSNNYPIQNLINHEVYPGLDVIPANLSLTRLELLMSQKLNREKILSKILEPCKKPYDFIMIDTNPTISLLNQNATLACDHLNIVCETQPYSLKGLELLVDEVRNFENAMEKKINYSILPNKYESKTATSQEVLGAIRSDYQNHVIEAVVRKCEDFNISAKHRLPIYATCSNKSVALEDTIDLLHEFIKRAS